MSRLQKAVALALVIVATLVADAGVVVARGGEAATTASPPLSTLAPNKLQATLPELEAFVEQTRGLQFKRPPKVTLLADDQFEKLLQGGPDDGATSEDQHTTLGVLRALGLIDGDVSLDAVAQQQVSDVVGFYDDQTKELYVRGADATAYAKETLVHELTHALDDQHFGLYHPELDDPDKSDAQSAYQALVEGDAMYVENAWHDSRAPEEQDAIDAADGAASAGTDTGSEPDVFTKVFAFPYVVGPRFVSALRDAGGQTRLDDAFVHPPTTTEQVMAPDRFLAGEGARQVPAPRADGKVIDEGSLGQLGLILVTDAAVTSNDVAARAAAGWGGDSYRAWTDGDRTCIRVNIQMDTPADTTSLVKVLKAWAAQHPGATVSGTDPIEIANCG